MRDGAQSTPLRRARPSHRATAAAGGASASRHGGRRRPEEANTAGGLTPRHKGTRPGACNGGPSGL
eukprot:621675-Alexandrium_andersonii.AAC.1